MSPDLFDQQVTDSLIEDELVERYLAANNVKSNRKNRREVKRLMARNKRRAARLAIRNSKLVDGFDLESLEDSELY